MTPKVITLSTVFCIILFYVVEEYYLNLIGFFGILSFGIVHGANDLILLKKSKNNLSFKSLFIVYLTMVILSGCFFYLIPTFAIIFFILFSAYHFGEQQWTMLYKSSSTKIKLFYFFYGLLLFLTLFTLNHNYVSEIIFDITGFSISEKILISLLSLSAIGAIINLFMNFNELKNQLTHQVFFMIILTALFFSSSLIWSFAVYFVIWHSIPSIIEQSKFIYGTSTKNTFIKYLKDASIYWVISIIGLLIAYYVLKDQQNLLISIFFSFLAAITFPHTLVIFKIKKNN
jgi:Brp/Blh family beta-carotene 15,15'-monooxygenase|tara:strand:+ start:3477 stop:4337 length:861 start_codon:yes stop_codon:yes gene_type:complete